MRRRGETKVLVAGGGEGIETKKRVWGGDGEGKAAARRNHRSRDKEKKKNWGEGRSVWLLSYAGRFS